MISEHRFKVRALNIKNKMCMVVTVFKCSHTHKARSHVLTAMMSPVGVPAVALSACSHGDQRLGHRCGGHSPRGRCSWRSRSRRRRCAPCRGRCAHTWCGRRSGRWCSVPTGPRCPPPPPLRPRLDHCRCPLCRSQRSRSCSLWTGQSVSENNKQEF